MKIFIHSGTHWDREWYQSFQGFRFRLVNMMNDLIDGLETTPDYGVFHSDGQTVIFEDFLEIEPQQRERLTKLIQSGKIAVGPWYCMPDEFLCSGESIIKNLRRGMRISKEFGVEHCHNGYICDIFGHAAQTPQIFSSLNLHHSILGRGTNEHTTPRFFRWTSPDGSDVRVFRLEDVHGYGDYTAISNGPQDDESLKARFKAYFDQRLATSNIPIVVTMNAIDHDHMHREVGNQVRILKELYPDAEIYHVNADEAGKAVDEYIDELPRVYGELAEAAKVNAGYLHVITNTLSSRYPIKKANDTLQTRMEKWIAPAYALGLTYASLGYLDLADKYLIQNHPHDSICGCSIDQVHRDMMYRFDQTRMLGDEIMKTVAGKLSGDLSAWKCCDGYAPEAAADDLVLRIFNPLPYERTETVTVNVTFPKGYHQYREPFGYEGINSFKLYDAQGNEVPYGLVDIVLNNGNDTYTLALRTKLTAGGVTELLIKRSDMPSRYVEKLVTGQRTAENEHIAIRVNNDGTIDLTDKKSSVTYEGLLAAIDDGEIGDGWYHCNPAIDRAVLNNAADIEISENNAMRVTYKITQHLNLPVAYTRGDWMHGNWGIHRSDEYANLDVVHFVTLAKGERKLAVKTAIDNKILDHRLRLRLPTGIKGKTYYASQPFCIIPRDTDDKPETANWKEYWCIEKNTTGIVAKYNDKGGFAFVSNYGLHECGVSGDGNMDITLFRAFCKTVQTRGEIDGELLQKMTFEYSLLPLDADTPLAELAKAQDIAAAGLEAYTVKGSAAAVYRPLFKLEGDALVYSSAAPIAEGNTRVGTEIRFWNCSDEEATGVLTIPEGYSEASMVELDGREIAKLAIEDGKAAISAGKWKIVTVKLTK
ncbi:MAG: hypothetical protein IJA85_07115 [Clostridia bacterium]|nr:hypothetical protein [Clostridia bacterium]